MSDREQIKPTAHELMKMHVEAMFTHDRNMRLRTINEPWPGEPPAPRFFLGRTIEGSALCRFRYDVPETLARQLEELCADEPVVRDFQTKPKHFEAYMNLLQSERFTMGPCYLIPETTVPTMEVVSVTRENVTELARGGFEWLTSDIDYAQPCIALVREGRAVSICRSVRIASRAHEAGLETLEEFRGKGYAAAVVAGWARAVRNMKAAPLYSTLCDNLSSQRVARKSGLSFYGVNFTIV
ncbi:kasugamycin N-acetyltransferase AAC(2')-IIb [Paenibacillus elgii]|uniref:kasugamycin N-acetyltransferase AAC(2')-IIb n=1 Tax=Paenibacillus elgii TaxID=189691 RepID=UPI001F3C8C77|nr:kasugamycin N-acetyltransferase AAC(2')-IIb [Paenibacillus elgii]